jgi:hypothetical protein
MAAKNVKETRVYKLAFELAMEIFEVTKTFPKRREIFFDRSGKEVIKKCVYMFT